MLPSQTQQADDSHLERFKELMEDEGNLSAFIQLYAPDLPQKVDSLTNAINGILNDSNGGCPMCDSGKLRDPEKEHWDSCPYLIAKEALGKQHPHGRSLFLPSASIRRSYLTKFVQPDKLYPVSYIIREDGTKVEGPAELLGQDLTEQQTVELFLKELL